MLADFEGTILFVSHDRYLIQALATQIWALETGTLHLIPGSWADYLQWKAQRKVEVRHTRERRASKVWEKSKQARRERKQREKALARQAHLEESIHRLEERLVVLGEALGEAGEAQDMERLHRLGEEYQAVERRLAQLWQEWEQMVEQEL